MTEDQQSPFTESYEERRARVLALEPFVPPTADKPLLLCFNENPFGMSRRAREAVQAVTKRASRYTFVRTGELRRACGEFMGATEKNILMTFGSAEAIRASIEAYLCEGVQVVVPELSYADGESAAVRNGLVPVKVPMGENWSVDLAAMCRAVEQHEGPSVVYLANPSNPTSTITDSAALNDWIASKPRDVFFVIDEAYAEFVDDPAFVSAKTLVDQGLENVAVMKTFSKIFGLAGLRIGFAYAAPAVIERIRRRVAYDAIMSAPGVEAALAELPDQDFFAVSREENRAARRVLTDCLDELHLPYLPSQTNFVFVHLKTGLEEFTRSMEQAHVLVGRAFPPALEWCRISVGTREEMAFFADLLRQFRAQGKV